MRFLVTLYERLKLAKNVIGVKLRKDINNLKEEYGLDVSKLEDDFEILKEYRFK